MHIVIKNSNTKITKDAQKPQNISIEIRGLAPCQPYSHYLPAFLNVNMNKEHRMSKCIPVYHYSPVPVNHNPLYLYITIPTGFRKNS